jgi:hypothetical protein
MIHKKILILLLLCVFAIASGIKNYKTPNLIPRGGSTGDCNDASLNELVQESIDSNRKLIIVTGGVLSGIGKGVTASSIGVLFRAMGYRVTALKIDPYLNVDAGTMSPAEHGEVFVLDDGGETGTISVSMYCSYPRKTAEVRSFLPLLFPIIYRS